MGQWLNIVGINGAQIVKILQHIIELLGVLSLALIAGGYLWLRKKEISPLPLTGLALMAGGAAGNMFDRLIRGFVPDMIETQFVNFPVFNAADSCLVIGCVLVMVSILTAKEGTGIK